MMHMIRVEWIAPKIQSLVSYSNYEHLYKEAKELALKGMTHRNIAKRFKISPFSVNALLDVPERY